MAPRTAHSEPSEMIRRATDRTTLLVVLLCLCSCSTGTPEEVVERLPNLVIIFIDDMGYGDIGPFGSTVNRTPHLDRMAAEGMKLTSFYAAPLCTPSRAALMTGSYPIRNGLQTGSWHPVLMPADTQGIHADELNCRRDPPASRVTRPEMVGKWHLGDQPEFLPTQNGFDYYYGLPYSNDMSPFMPRNPRNHPPIPLLRNNEVILEVPEDQSFLTGSYTEEALRFIEQTSAVALLSLSGAHHGSRAAVRRRRTSAESPAMGFSAMPSRSSTGASARFSASWKSSAWPKTPSSYSPRTTARPAAAQAPCGDARAAPMKAACASPPSPGGRGRCLPPCLL